MIDWDLTAQRFGRRDFKGDKPKVVVRCDKCSKSREIRIRNKSKIIDGQMRWECPRCVALRASVRVKLSEATKKQWESEDYRRQRSKHSRELWLDEDFRQKVIHGELRHHYGDDADIEVERQKRRHIARLKWQRKTKPWSKRTPEQEEKHRLCSIKWWQKNRERILELKKAYRRRQKLPIYGTTVAKCKKAKFFNIFFAHRARYVIAGTPEPYPTTQQLAEILEKYRKGSMIRCHHCQKVVSVFHYDHLGGITDKPVDASRIVISCPRCNLQRAHYNVRNRIKLDDYYVQEIEYCEANRLLKDHFLGVSKKIMKAFGLYKHDRLIGVAAFSVPAHPSVGHSIGVCDNEIMDLERLFVIPKERVPNLMSWFIRRSIRYLHKIKPHLKAVISFCEHQFEGGSHIAAGMIPLETHSKERMYVDKNGQLHRRVEIYRKARKAGMRESEYAASQQMIQVVMPPKTKFLVPLDK